MLKIDQEKCIGCGACQSICPEVFEMDINNQVILKSDKKVDCIKEAIESCPVNAIN